jgi:hypothetical protein
MPKDKIPQGILIHVHANHGQKKNKRGTRAHPRGFLKETVVWTALIGSNGHNKMDSCTIKHTVNCNGVGLY